jgi:hypothetical protein
LSVGFGEITGDGRLDQGVHVIADHVGLHAPQRRNDGIDLMCNVHAVATRFDHLLNTAHLPLDAPKPRDLLLVLDRDAPVVRFGT